METDGAGGVRSSGLLRSTRRTRGATEGAFGPAGSASGVLVGCLRSLCSRGNDERDVPIAVARARRSSLVDEALVCVREASGRTEARRKQEASHDSSFAPRRASGEDVGRVGSASGMSLGRVRAFFVVPCSRVGGRSACRALARARRECETERLSRAECSLRRRVGVAGWAGSERGLSVGRLRAWCWQRRPVRRGGRVLLGDPRVR